MSQPRFTTTCLRLRVMLPLLVAVSAAVAARPTAVADDIRPERTLSGHHFEVYSVAFSPDGKTLASGDAYLDADLKPGEIMLWDVGTGKLLRSLKGHTGGVWSVAFSPDGTTLASGSADKSLMLWDVTTGQAKATLKGHTEWVRSVGFTPDGKTVASGSNDQTIKLWDLATGRERMTLKGHTAIVTCLAIWPDGKTLASNGFDNTVGPSGRVHGQGVEANPPAPTSATPCRSPRTAASWRSAASGVCTSGTLPRDRSVPSYHRQLPFGNEPRKTGSPALLMTEPPS